MSPTPPNDDPHRHSSSSSSSSLLPPPPPKLQFDDGIRNTTTTTGSSCISNNNTSTSNDASSISFPENPRLQQLVQSQPTNVKVMDDTQVAAMTRSCRSSSSGSSSGTTFTTTNTSSNHHPHDEHHKVTSICDYYEIERLITEIRHIAATVILTPTTASSTNTSTSSTTNTTNGTTITIRIAIQLPDELLMDALEICQAYEQAFRDDDDDDDDDVHQQQQQEEQLQQKHYCHYNKVQYNVYILGDTTYAPCCPDRIAAQHIQAHILIHYGHACFSNIHCFPTTTTTATTKTNPSTVTGSTAKHHPPPSQPPSQPQQSQQYPIVLYSFGKPKISIVQCANDVVQALQRECQNEKNHSKKNDNNNNSTPSTTIHSPKNILLLYEVQYTHAMNELRRTLRQSSSATTMNDLNNNDDANADHDHSTVTPCSVLLQLFIKMGRVPPLDNIRIESATTTASSSSSSSEQPEHPLPQNHRNTNSGHCCHNDDLTTTSVSSPSSFTPNGGCDDTLSTCCREENRHHPTKDSAATSTMSHSNRTAVPQHLSPLPTMESKLLIPNDDDDDDANNTNHNFINTNMAIQEQYHHIMVGGLELPFPFSSAPNADHDNDDDEWVSSSNQNDTTTNYIILYIGDVTSRPFLNIVLRFLSTANITCVDHRHNANSNNNANNIQPQQYQLSSIWAWTPTKAAPDTTSHLKNYSYGRLCTDVLQNSNLFQKMLQRRYYLIQKAKHCTVFGIIVAHMTPNVQAFVTSIQQYLDQQQRHGGIHVAHYTFVVGKINPTKLANFPEIECFILVACPEHALLQNERELYPIPIITPYELLVAFGSSSNSNSSKNSNRNIEWGDTPYSTYPNDYWTVASAVADLNLTETALTNSDNDNVNIDHDYSDNNNDDDDDAPYFSLVTGKYETRTKSVVVDAASTSNTLVTSGSKPDDNASNDVTTLSTRTDGTIVQFGNNKSTSAAADFFKQREYQGLVVMTPYEEQQRENSEESETANSNISSLVQPAIVGRTGIASNYSNR